MALFFSPPVRLIGATTLADPHPGNQLMRHFKPNRVGINVYLMPGNVLTEVDPYSDLEAVRVFHGGHIHPIDATEAALLVAAGYGLNVLTLPDAVVSPGVGIPDPVTGGTVLPGGNYSPVYEGAYT